MSEPPAKNSSFSQPIKIIVGPTITGFHIDADLLRASTSNLAIFLDPVTNTIKLPHKDPEVFVHFLTWLTRGSINLCSEFPNLDNESGKDVDVSALMKKRLDQWHQLVCAYILGVYLGSVDFKNTVMDLLVDKAQVVTRENKMAAEIHPSTLKLIYASTDPESPLRRLAFQVGLNHLDLTNIPAGIACEFWTELAKAAIPLFRISESGHDISAGPWITTIDKLNFHERQL